MIRSLRYSPGRRQSRSPLVNSSRSLLPGGWYVRSLGERGGAGEGGGHMWTVSRDGFSPNPGPHGLEMGLGWTMYALSQLNHLQSHGEGVCHLLNTQCPVIIL